MGVTVTFIVSPNAVLLSESNVGTLHQRPGKRIYSTSWGNGTCMSGTDYSSTPSTTFDVKDSESESAPPSAGMELDTEMLKSQALSALSDVSSRPAFYAKIAGYAAGALVALTILRAVVSAVDSIPILPSALELIGLGYTTWFVWRYVLFKESREELLEEIEDFLGRARPSSSE